MILMFSKRISFSGLRRLAPRAKAPQVTRAAGPQAWNLRRAAVGLEVRGNDLYAACVRAGWNRRWVAATAVIENWAQLSAEDLRARLADVASGADDPLIVLGLPRRELMVRHLELPAAAARQLDSVLQLQLGLYKPSDDEEVYWDAAVVEHGEKLGIDLALVPTTRVQELASLLRAARYPIARVTTAQFAAMDWVLRVRGATEADGRLMLVQGHGSEVELAILDGPRCVFTRSFPLPANTDAGEHIANQARQALASLRGARDGAFTVLIAGDGCEQWRDALQPLGSVEHLGRYAQTDALADPADAQREEFWGALALALNGLSWTGDYRLNLLPRELRPARRRWQNVPTYALLTANVLLLAALAGRAPLQRHILLKRYEYELSRVERQATQVERQVKK